jgi:hypothetical protein
LLSLTVKAQVEVVFADAADQVTHHLVPSLPLEKAHLLPLYCWSWLTSAWLSSITCSSSASSFCNQITSNSQSTGDYCGEFYHSFRVVNKLGVL